MFISRVSRHRFGAYSALLLLEILSTIHHCSARKINNYCAPSSCGNFDHISYPFRLSNDPESCGNKNYELACENNERLTLHLNMVKYYVQAINYSDSTIRIVDASVQKDDCFSVPHPLSFRPLDYSVKSQSTLVFITCENPIRTPLSYVIDTSSCKNGSSTAYNSSSSSRSISSPSFINMEGYSYVMVGDVYSADIPDLCLVNLIYPVPESLILPENMASMSSYIDVHDVLTYGIELSCWNRGQLLFNRYRLDSKSNYGNMVESRVVESRMVEIHVFTRNDHRFKFTNHFHESDHDATTCATCPLCDISRVVILMWASMSSDFTDL
ncbi:hypothetical protein SADUNF_Sadunf17G0000800 [Salix dunnii]|uniref:Wall-associated receptor kinase galacturonan-binding domain-containing protein n=1 Tax=Salix dunnii TaxID=1413687 RepID=A0A835J4E6_9ROSI|nr:hypothetical protein SADUNF_Sadunf17G0000800 [Salix dunnii]